MSLFNEVNDDVSIFKQMTESRKRKAKQKQKRFLDKGAGLYALQIT